MWLHAASLPYIRFSQTKMNTWVLWRDYRERARGIERDVEGDVLREEVNESLRKITSSVEWSGWILLSTSNPLQGNIVSLPKCLHCLFRKSILCNGYACACSHNQDPSFFLHDGLTSPKPFILGHLIYKPTCHAMEFYQTRENNLLWIFLFL